MAKIDSFNSYLMDRFSSLAGDIFEFVQVIVSEQQDEINRTKEENRNLRNMLAEAKLNKGNSGTDANTTHPDGPTLEQQNSDPAPLDTSLLQVKLELGTLEPGAEPELLTEAPMCIAPSPKKTYTEKLNQSLPPKTKEKESLKMNSYLTINLVPCDAQFVPDAFNSDAVRNESVSGGCEKDTKEEGLHACPYCTETFSDFPLLASHLESHGGPFYCQMCGRHFKNRATLKNHMIVHQKIRGFRCHFCGKGFHQKGHLKEHERIHTGEKPYACSVCGRRFTQYNHVKVHVRNHHQDFVQPAEKTKRKR